MNRFEFYKSLYETEINKITELNNSLNIPLAIIGVIGASLYTLSMSFVYDETNLNTKIFILLCFLSAIFLLISIVYFVNVFAFSFRKDYNYRFLENTNELEEFFMSMQDQGNSLLEFEEFIIRRYVLFCDANARINKVKNTNLNIGKDFLAASLIILIGDFIPFAINHFYHL